MAFVKSFAQDRTNIAFRLMVTLGMLTKYIETSYTITDDLLLVSRHKDKIHSYFSHLVDTLCFFGKENDFNFSDFCPNEPEKIVSMHLTPAYSFQILRCNIPNIYDLTTEQRLHWTNIFKYVLDTNMERKLEAAREKAVELGDKLYWDEAKFLEQKKSEIWDKLNPSIYFIFWCISLHELQVPEKQYNAEIKTV